MLFSDIEERSWVIFGYGRVGRLVERIAQELNKRSEEVFRRKVIPTITIWEYNSERDTSEIDISDGTVCWFTVVDDAIGSVSNQVYQWLGERISSVMFVHCSGSLDSTILLPNVDIEDINEVGMPNGRCSVASLHPLLSVTLDTDSAFRQVAKVVWSIEGSVDSVDYLKKCMGMLGVHPIEITAEKKPLYHAAAVAASGLIVSTFSVALELAENAGFTKEDAFKMLLPLVDSTIANLKKEHSIERALTGPMARKDYGIVQRHLVAMDDMNLPREVQDIYRVLVERFLR